MNVTPCPVKGQNFLSFIQEFLLYADKLKVVITILHEKTLAISISIACTKDHSSAEKQWQLQIDFPIGQRG